MKKIICLLLCLMMLTSVVGAKPISRRWFLVPAFLTAVGSCYCAKNPPVWYDQGLVMIEYKGVFYDTNPRHVDYAPTWILGITSVFFTLCAVGPLIEIKPRNEGFEVRKIFKF